MNMITDTINKTHNKKSIVPFWVLWTLELWERFRYYGFQAILAVYFAKRQIGRASCRERV